MKPTFTLLTALGLAALVAGGCSNKLVFATHTSYGLDVSGTAEIPNRVSFSYNRQETAIVPRKTDGEAHSVFGGLDSDIHWWEGAVIKQTFATGEAAKIATGSARAAGAHDTTTKTNSTKPLIFLTGTTFGLHLSAGDGQVQPSLLMGYRRAEAAYIPVPDPAQEVRSVYADVLINTKSPTNTTVTITTNFPTMKGVRIKQSFATGLAAENLAAKAETQLKLRVAAGLASEALVKVATEEGDIARRVEALPAAKRAQLFSWADAQFPVESGGRLAEADSLSRFENSFLPQLDDRGRGRVLEKIKELEDEP